MTRDRLALLVTSSALLVSWLSSPAWPTTPATSQPLPPPDVTTPQEPVEELAFDVARETERLRERMASVPTPRRGGRDPFRFQASRPAISRPLPQYAAPVARAVPEETIAPTRPVLKLIGVAERQAPDGPIRTAILSGASDVYILAIGDTVLGRFTVTAIEPEAVELTETITSAVARLALPR